MRSPVRLLALLCVFLVAVNGCAQAFHVHREISKPSNHECSICLAAHSGVLIRSPYCLDPVFVRTPLSVPL